MPCRTRRFPPLLLGLVALGAAPGDDQDNLRQLQSMPRERRAALAENLERFDKLSPAEQAAILQIDAGLARKDPVERARYRALLRRYHAWLNGLTEDQKAQLESAESVEAKLDLAVKIRRDQEEDGVATGPRLFGIRTGDFGVIGPHEMAHLLRIWKLLTPAKKVEIGRLTPRNRLFREVHSQGKSVGVTFQPFPAAELKKYDARLDASDAFKKQLGALARQVEPARKSADTPARPDAVPRWVDLRFAEFLYFEDHKPASVSQANLERFASSAPEWLREMIDPLSPDDARAYLTIVYRLLYPEPNEMPVDPRAPKATAPPSPKAVPNKSGGNAF